MHNSKTIVSTLFDKIWNKHIVKQVEDNLYVLYIDRHYIHEVTSPQAFEGINNRGVEIHNPDSIIAVMDHNVPTINRHIPIKDKQSRQQIEQLEKNCKEHNVTLFNLNHPNQGVVHVTGPELGYSEPGMTIVCGDSHTSTHGAFGTIAFGIGTSEVELVFATQCILQQKPKQMRINIDGNMQKGVTAKDLILYIISRVGANGGTGYFVEFAGNTIKSLSMDERMTLCNMSIEMGAKGGLIAPDAITMNYLLNTDKIKNSDDINIMVSEWEQLKTDREAKFDNEINIDVSIIKPMITYGTSPETAIAINDEIPVAVTESESKALKYMGYKPLENLEGKPINYVFLGSCTNGRINDFRDFATIVKGRKKASNVVAYIVPGSKKVMKQAEEEGLLDIIKEAGFEIREPGCSACLAMNDDKIPENEYCVATSNRNFEGRQGANARTILASPMTAAASAITGCITDPRVFVKNEERVQIA